MRFISLREISLTIPVDLTTGSADKALKFWVFILFF